MENGFPISEAGFLRRIGSLVGAMGMAHSLRDDLIQETCLRCLEYSRRHSKPLHCLSSQELRLRCLEARRKVLPDHRVLLSNCLPEAEEPGSPRDQRPEEPGSPGDLLDEILIHHPALRLTPLQQQLWQMHSKDPDSRWKAAKAMEMHCSRQNISNIVRHVQKKVQEAIGLVRLLEGDILPFFERIHTGWAESPVRNLLWSVLRPKTGDPVSPVLQRCLEAIEGPMLQLALQTIEAEGRKFRSGSSPSAKQLGLAYNILISAIHIRPEGTLARQCLEELAARIPRRSWVLNRFVLRAGHLASRRLREAHREWLKERICRRDEAGLAFASYAAAYYGGTTPEGTQLLLEGDGRTPLQTVSYEPVVKRLYDNIQIPRYNASPVWMDINFLRILLMESHFPFTASPLSHRSKNALTILCQKALHSQDPWLAERAEGFLAKLQKNGAASFIVRK